MKKLNADPAHRARHAEAMKKLNADPKFVAKRNKAREMAFRDPALAEKRANTALDLMNKMHADRRRS
jgi:hypothetical protein